jgi:hypothetical protein
VLFLIFFGLGVLTGAAIILYGKEIEEKARTAPKHSERFQFQDQDGMDIEAISKAVLELLASRDDARSGFEPGATMRRSTRFFSEDELQEAAENLRRLLRK